MKYYQLPEIFYIFSYIIDEYLTSVKIVRLHDTGQQKFDLDRIITSAVRYTDIKQTIQTIFKKYMCRLSIQSIMHVFEFSLFIIQIFLNIL